MASGGNDAELKYYNLETEEGVVYSHHTRKVLRMTVHPDHPYSFMSCSADGTVRMIDTRQNYEASNTGPIETVSGRDGEVVPQALGGGRGLFRGAQQGGIPISSSLILNYRTRTSSPELYSVDFNPMNGHQFIVGSDCGDIRLFDLRQIRERSSCSYINLFTHKLGSTDDFTGCVFSRDGRFVVGTALSDAIYTWDVNINYEKQFDFPMCTKNAGGGRREPCDSKFHSFSSSMLSNYNDWQVSNREKQQHPHHDHSHTNHSVLSSSDDEEDDDDSDDNDMQGIIDDSHETSLAEETSSSAMDISYEDTANHQEPRIGEASQNRPRAKRTATHTEGDQAEAHEHENGEDGESERSTSATGGTGEQEGPVRPNLNDLLGAWPFFTGEGGTMTIDIETFLRLAASVARDRPARTGGTTEEDSEETGGAERERERRRRRRRRPEPIPGTTSEPSASTSSETTSSVPKKPEEPSTSQSTDESKEKEGQESSGGLRLPSPARLASPHGPLLVPTSSTASTSTIAPIESSSTTSMEASTPTSSKKAEKSAPETPKSPKSTTLKTMPLPEPYLRRFTGHASVQTIKGVNFWGPNSEFVVSGSDDANVFIWDRDSGELLNVLEGHDDVVNCVVGHPRLPIMATSGIDDIIKLWEPSGPLPPLSELKTRIQTITGANARHRRFERGIQCAQQ